VITPEPGTSGLGIFYALAQAEAKVGMSQGADVLPIFSPDGKYLIWTSKRSADGTTQIFLANFHLPPGS
jgi:Tol biopolymer transport system component